MNCIIASTSTVHGSDYLDYLKPELEQFFKKKKKLIFIPFARPGGISHDNYTKKVKKALGDIFSEIKGLHEFQNPSTALKNAEAIFTGGGNTFLLVKQLHDLRLMKVLKQVVSEGAFYLGTSAGSNICGLNMKTTNDMPIVYPSSFKTLGLLNFNINPHFLDADPNSTHKGETRETRILEFQKQNNLAVVGLREGSYILVENENIVLKGPLPARIFEINKPAYELNPNQSLNFF